MPKTNGKILIIDDDKDILLTTRVILKKHFDVIDTALAPVSYFDRISEGMYDVILLDMNFKQGSTSGKEGIEWLKKIITLDLPVSVVMITAYGEVNLAVRAMKEGAVDFVVKPWDNDKLLATVMSAYRLSESRREIHRLRSMQQTLSHDIDLPFSQMVGKSQAMQQVFQIIRKVGPTDANILILGENGAGKELVARAIHRHSSRNKQVFIPVDLGAIPETLFEAELFGHVRGAFTGASEERSGRFEIASGGTLFLDEIGNLPLHLQSKLLTSLHNREFTKVGSNKPVSTDIRLICATNMPLPQMAKENRFRQDLLYRINTVEIHLPPLHMRREDIPLLASHFTEVYSKKYNKSVKLSADSLRKLSRYDFPGNVRELQHMVERAVIMSDDQMLRPADFLLESSTPPKSRQPSLNIEDLEKSAIQTALLKHAGNLSKAAIELGMGRTTLYRKINKYDL